MKTVVESILRHPISTGIIVGVTTLGIANIVRAVRGVQVDPLLTINVSKKKAE